MKILMYFFLFVLLIYAIPLKINYQGRLLNDDGIGINDTLPITFSLFTSAESITPIWEETHTSVNINKGLFSVSLGSVDSFPDSINFQNPYWLEISIASEPLSPREELLPSPYAISSVYTQNAIQSVYSSENSEQRLGRIMFSPGSGATISDSGDSIIIVIGGDDFIPTLAQILATGGNANNQPLTGLPEPINPSDVATKNYVDINLIWENIGNKDLGAGDGLSISSNSFNLNVDNSSIEIVTDTLQIKGNGVTSLHINDGSIEYLDLSPSLQESYIMNQTDSIQTASFHIAGDAIIDGRVITSGEYTYVGQFDVPSYLDATISDWTKVNDRRCVGFSWDDYNDYVAPGQTLYTRLCAGWCSTSTYNTMVRIVKDSDYGTQYYLTSLGSANAAGAALIHHSCGEWVPTDSIPCGYNWGNCCEIQTKNETTNQVYIGRIIMEISVK